MSKTSQKDIANRANVSTSSVEDVLCNIASNAILRHSSLPVAMNWDEFKATTDTKSKMAFIIMDNINGTIFDINDSRYSSDLYKYFSRYPRSERNKVKLISTDFYSGYINTAKQLFRNANIVIDRFHIVTQIYKALNGVRINLCKKSNPNYNKLKRYWKLILMNEDKLTDKKKYSKYFRKEISNKDIVTFLVNTDKAFKANYECYQGLLKALDKRDFNKFNQIINHPNKYIDPKMKKAFRLFKSHIKYIENAFNYEINNGIIEGTNNLIKCIKRIAFGYRKFKNFMTRILLIKGILKG
jgi:transposase